MIKIKNKSILHNTLILTSANIIIRALGFIYKIILSRKIGPQAIGLFQLVLPIYILAITVTTSGIPIGISKIIAGYNAKNKKHEMLYSMKIFSIFVSIISIILSFVFILNAKFISNYLLNDSKTYIVLITIFPCIFIVSLCSIYRGFFYGIHDVVPAASASILEQVTRIGLVFTVLFLLPPLKTEYAAALAALGMVIGELFGLLLIRINFKKYTKNIKQNKQSHLLNPISLNMLKQLLTIALPITATRLVNTLMQTLNTILIPQRLQITGFNAQQAISEFGKLTGMAMPIIMLPFTATSALAVVMIPNLSESLELNNWHIIRNKIAKTTLATSLLGFFIFSFIFSLSNQLGEIFFKQKDVGQIIFYMSFSIPFLCIYHNFSSILNGIGHQKIATINYMAGAIIQLLCTYFLVSNPKFKINGFIIGFILNIIITMTLDGIWIYKKTQTKIKITTWLIRPFICTLPTIYSIKNIYTLLINIGSNIIVSIVIACITGTVLFGVTAYALKVLPKIRDFKK